jgi:1,4-dihydroxy-2-naphthoyl-CoA hydrolase
VDPSQLAQFIAQLDPRQRAELLTQASLGFDAHLGIRWSWVGDDRVVGEVEVTDAHVQPYGLVHGGVYCTLAEAACSIGAAMAVLPLGKNAVGVENRTQFRRAARAGTTLTVTATPVSVEGPRHTWRAEMVDRDGALCAVGEVVVRALDPRVRVAGAEVALQADVPTG